MVRWKILAKMDHGVAKHALPALVAFAARDVAQAALRELVDHSRKVRA